MGLIQVLRVSSWLERTFGFLLVYDVLYTVGDKAGTVSKSQGTRRASVQLNNMPGEHFFEVKESYGRGINNNHVGLGQLYEYGAVPL